MWCIGKTEGWCVQQECSWLTPEQASQATLIEGFLAGLNCIMITPIITDGIFKLIMQARLAIVGSSELVFGHSPPQSQCGVAFRFQLRSASSWSQSSNIKENLSHSSSSTGCVASHPAPKGAGQT